MSLTKLSLAAAATLLISALSPTDAGAVDQCSVCYRQYEYCLSIGKPKSICESALRSCTKKYCGGTLR